MERHSFDVIVIGAGIAGASAACFLAADRSVALVEAEDTPGYHTTGRSAAIWIRNYGPPAVRVMTGLSRPFFENPPEGFTETPLMSHRPAMYVAPRDQEPQLRTMLAELEGVEEISPREARALVPALREGWAVAAAIEGDAFDMEVAALLQGYLRLLRRRDGTTALRSRAGRVERKGGGWEVEVTGGVVFRAPMVINAAGAWGDEVARLAGIAPLGLQPKRRTGVIVDPAPWHVAGWPMVHDAVGSWYARAEARTKLMISPADETDLHPQDVQPDELDIAIAVDRVTQALDIDVRRVEHAWAGLRSFLPDRNLGIGWSTEADGFFWCVGQGGYGIQTSPAAGQLVADLVAGRDPGEIGRVLASLDPNRFARAA
jgi:D-arginine dehydrogenase